jgi:hypothetical protein
MAQAQAQVRRRHAPSGALGPFDQADGIFVEVFGKARIEKLLG